jgi:hypothetical protein
MADENKTRQKQSGGNSTSQASNTPKVPMTMPLPAVPRKGAKSNQPVVGRNTVSSTGAKSIQSKKLAETPKAAQPAPAITPRKSGKGNKAGVGGSAVAGAKSTQPKKLTESANPQQQQLESYNRDMRRRMERMGANDDDNRAKTVQNQRKKRAGRLKQRREQQLARVKRSLPGGKIDTNPRRVYFMIAGVAIAIVVLIAVFAILRANHVL